jgi:hypothetical protein
MKVAGKGCCCQVSRPSPFIGGLPCFRRPLTPSLGAIPNRTDDHTAESLPVVWTNNVLVTVIPAAMIVAMVVIVVMVVVVGVVVLVFIFVLLANLEQVGEIQRSK